MITYYSGMVIIVIFTLLDITMAAVVEDFMMGENEDLELGGDSNELVGEFRGCCCCFW
jgi:hypothetical protein